MYALLKDAQSAQAPLKNKLPTGKPIRLPSSGNGVKNPVASKQNMQSKGGSVKVTAPHRPMPTSVASRRISVASVANANQSSKTAGNRTTLQKVPSRSTNVNMPVKKVIDNPSTKKHLSSVKHPNPSVQKNYHVQNKSLEEQKRQKIMEKRQVPSKVQVFSPSPFCLSNRLCRKSKQKMISFGSISYLSYCYDDCLLAMLLLCLLYCCFVC